MRANASLLLRLVCSIALVFSALPTRAGVVCVERGRVVGRCPMASIPEATVQRIAEQPPAMARMPCCRSRATEPKAGVESSDVCPIHKGTRCAYAYRSGLSAVAPARPSSIDLPLPPVAVLLPAAPLEVSYEILVGAGGGAFAGDPDPPRSRPRTSDRGRAPPMV